MFPKKGAGSLAAHQFNVIVTSNMRMFRSLPVIQSRDVRLSAVIHISINVTCPIGNLGGGEKEVLARGVAVVFVFRSVPQEAMGFCPSAPSCCRLDWREDARSVRS